MLRASLASEFKVLDEVGRGGMAVVFLVEERATGRSLAAKVLRQDLQDDTKARARFALEASVVASIDHPNVVRLHGLRTLRDGSAELLLDFAPGGTLKQRLRAKNGVLEREEIDRVLGGVALALAAVHSHEVVHRDVKKLDNVFFGPNGDVLLGDFGIARAPV